MLDILRESAQQAVDRFKSNLHTSLPGTIVRVSDDGTSVDVQPAVDRRYEDGETEQSPVILNVPVIMPGSQQALVSIPLVAGDSVMLLFAQRDIDNWMISDTALSIAAPTERTFDMQDAVAIPGLYTGPRNLNRPANHAFAHNPKDLVVAMNIGTGTEVEMRLTQSGNMIVNTKQNVLFNIQDYSIVATGNVDVQASGNVTVTAPTTTVNGNAVVNGNASVKGDVSITGNTTISGILTLAGINMNTHTHPGVMSGPSFTGPPI